MSVALDHGLGFPAAQPLQFVRWCACLAMPSRKSVAQIVPPEIIDSCPQQRIAPCLGIDLDDGILFVGEHVTWVVAVPLLQHI